MARPSKYKAEYEEQAYKLCLLGATDVQMADFFGVSKATITTWKKNKKGFSASIILGRSTTRKKYRTPKKGNPQTIKSYAKKYYQEHKEQFKIKAIARYHTKKGLLCDLTLAEWGNALNHFSNRCAYCGDTGKLQKEHIIPVSRGGGFTRNNIVPACIPCNQSKGSLPLHEWYKYSVVYSDERLLNIIGWMYGKEARAKVEVQFGLSRQTG